MNWSPEGSPPTSPAGVPSMGDCRLGRVEHDGYAYCYEHHGWWLFVTSPRRCDRNAHE